MLSVRIVSFTYCLESKIRSGHHHHHHPAPSSLLRCQSQVQVVTCASEQLAVSPVPKAASPVLCGVTQSHLTLCDPLLCSLPVSTVYGDSPGQNTGVGFHAQFQGIFPTRGSNPDLLLCRWILYQLSYQGGAPPLQLRFD